MKISNKLPRFAEPTLIIVSTSNGSVFYLAQDDEIKAIADFVIEKPEYSDREDYGRRPDGGVYESGTIMDKKKKIINRDFKEKFNVTLADLMKKFPIRRMYLFTAKHLFNLLEGLVPKKLQAMIANHVKGDFSKEHLFKVLGRIRINEDRSTTEVLAV